MFTQSATRAERLAYLFDIPDTPAKVEPPLPAGLIWLLAYYARTLSELNEKGVQK